MPTPAAADTLLTLFAERGGYLRAAEAAAAGLPRIELTRLARQGKVLRVARGVYRLRTLDESRPVAAEVSDLLEVQLRFPVARPCLVSALHLHGLTTTRPSRLQVAIPAHRQIGVIDDLPCEVFHFRAKYYGAGLFELPVLGRTLTTYTPEKTLCDLLRFAPRLGREIYLEGLKKYLRSPTARRHDLIRMAKTLGVWKPLSRDLEVLSHDQDH